MIRTTKLSMSWIFYRLNDDDLLSEELEELRPSYAKLASIANEQQKSLDKLQKTLDKQEDL